MLTEQIYAQCLLLAGTVDPQHELVLRSLCGATERSLRERLRPGVVLKKFEADFVLAAALYALGILRGVTPGEKAERFSVGDISVTSQPGDNSGRALMAQAELILAPYVKDGFCFRGV